MRRKQKMTIKVVDKSVTCKAGYKYGRIRGGIETIGVQFEPFAGEITPIELSDDEFREPNGR